MKNIFKKFVEKIFSKASSVSEQSLFKKVMNLKNSGNLKSFFDDGTEIEIISNENQRKYIDLVAYRNGFKTEVTIFEDVLYLTSSRVAKSEDDIHQTLQMEKINCLEDFRRLINDYINHYSENKAYIIYLKKEIILCKEWYKSWSEIQWKFIDYKANLPAKTCKETISFFESDFGADDKECPFSKERIISFFNDKNEDILYLR